MIESGGTGRCVRALRDTTAPEPRADTPQFPPRQNPRPRSDLPGTQRVLALAKRNELTPRGDGLLRHGLRGRRSQSEPVATSGCDSRKSRTSVSTASTLTWPPRGRHRAGDSLVGAKLLRQLRELAFAELGVLLEPRSRSHPSRSPPEMTFSSALGEPARRRCRARCPLPFRPAPAAELWNAGTTSTCVVNFCCAPAVANAATMSRIIERSGIAWTSARGWALDRRNGLPSG